MILKLFIEFTCCW